MIKVDEVVIVEGKHDKIKLSGIIDGLVLETNGFRIFNDKKRLDLIRKFALERGIIIFTDSDSAGFMIRNYLTSSVNKGKIFHAYIPDIMGKEKRKSKMSKEGKLGVEGVESEIIENAIKNCGSSVLKNNDNMEEYYRKIKFRFYELGYYGREFSQKKRENLKKHLNLPEYLTTNALISVLIRCFDIVDLEDVIRTVENKYGN